MIAILSPAKRMENKGEGGGSELSLPLFQSEAEKLIDVLRSYDVDGIKELMNVSDRIAELNHQRFAEWHPNPGPQEGRMALLAFQGDVYQGLSATSLDQGSLGRAQESLRILSGLYGVLRPKDLIMPYRLEMSTKLPNERAKDLYGFWEDRLTEQLKKELEEHDPRILIDLASQEYSKTIDKKGLDARIITPKFQEKKDGTYKTVPMKAKRARGLMGRFIVEEGIRNPEDLKGFDLEGYRYQEDLSEGDQWVFTKGI
ncbi:MAG: peroxide stress protein YaaA [Flavobacteriales bacterium]